MFKNDCLLSSNDSNDSQFYHHSIRVCQIPSAKFTPLYTKAINDTFGALVQVPSMKKNNVKIINKFGRPFFRFFTT